MQNSSDDYVQKIRPRPHQQLVDPKYYNGQPLNYFQNTSNTQMPLNNEMPPRNAYQNNMQATHSNSSPQNISEQAKMAQHWVQQQTKQTQQNNQNLAQRQQYFN